MMMMFISFRKLPI